MFGLRICSRPGISDGQAALSKREVISRVLAIRRVSRVADVTSATPPAVGLSNKPKRRVD